MDLSNLFEVLKNVGHRPYKDYVDEFTKDSLQSLRDNSDMFSRGMIFKQYKDLKDAISKIEEIRNKPNKASYERSALSYVSASMFNDYDSFTEEIKKPNQNLENIKAISSTIIANIKDLINLGGMYEKDRIIVTQDERGIFDFGLASAGLYRPIEFYSQRLADDINNGLPNPFKHLGVPAGVIENNQIERVGKTNVFAYSHNNTLYNAVKRQKGTTNVFNTFPDKCFLEANSENIILPYSIANPKKVFNGEGKARLKYASHTKKAYVIYEKKPDSVKYVDIFVPVNYLVGNNDSARTVNLLPAFLIASALEEYGISARISALRTGSDNSVNTTVSITVKDYTESAKLSFDSVFRLLATDSSAGSFFAFFKIYDSNNNEQGVVSGDESESFSPVRYDKQHYMNELIQRYKNWIKENKDKPFVNTKVSNDNFQFSLFQRSNQTRQLTYKEIFKELHFVFFQFYYYLDYLSMEFLPITEWVKQVYKRLTEDDKFRSIFTVPTEKTEILKLIRAYALGILAEKYEPIPSGKYHDSLEEIKRKEDIFKEKLEKLDESISLI